MCTVVFLLHTLSSGQSTTPDPTDFQVWSETTVSVPVVRDDKNDARVSFLMLGTIRLGQNRLYPVDRRIGAGFDWRINTYLNFSPTYLYRYGRSRRDRPADFEHRIRFDLTVQKKFEHFTIKDRNRVEYRAQNSKSDFVRYRNKVSLKVPVKKDGEEIFAPFVANEFFYSTADKAWSSNEFSTGVEVGLPSNTSAEIFYVYRTNDVGSIRTIHGVGANFKITID